MIRLFSEPILNNPKFYHYNFLEELQNALSTVAVNTCDSSYAVNLFFCRFRTLFGRQAWFKSIVGPKIIIEHDAYLNFMPNTEFYKSWTRFYHAVNFDLIISSGKRTTELLQMDGIPATWVPKGTNKKYLDYPLVHSGRIGAFTVPYSERVGGEKYYWYKSRHEMAESLKHDLDVISCPTAKFGDIVSKYAGACMNDATMQEPMAKHFECSALGCVPIRDDLPELYELGLGESMIVYQDFDEMNSKIEFYLKNPNSLSGIQVKCKEVAKNHTWRVRAEQVRKILTKYTLRVL